MSQMISNLIAATALRWDVPVELALAVAERESGLNQAAVGAAGEIGVFQLMPAAAAEMGVDRTTLAGNVEGGIRYLRTQFDRFGSWTEALAAYNAGPGNISRGRIPSSTAQYVDDVLAAAGDLPSGGRDTGGFPVLRYGGINYPGSTVPFWLGIAAGGLALLLFPRR